LRLFPHPAQHLGSFLAGTQTIKQLVHFRSRLYAEASVHEPMCWHHQLAHARGATSCASTPKARGLRQGEASPCGRRYRPQTPTPHPSLLAGIGIASGGSPFLLSTSLDILREASRVRGVRRKQKDGGGVFLAAPSALCGSPVCLQGRTGFPVLPWQCNALLWPLLLPRSNNCGLDWLAS
jgi:hypothetical protein